MSGGERPQLGLFDVPEAVRLPVPVAASPWPPDWIGVPGRDPVAVWLDAIVRPHVLPVDVAGPMTPATVRVAVVLWIDAGAAVPAADRADAWADGRLELTARVSLADLESSIGCSSRTVKTALAALEAAGMIMRLDPRRAGEPSGSMLCWPGGAR